jgi:uncharacterized protein (DUF1800 family)
MPTPTTADWRQQWRPYAPTPDAPWDLRRVVHLHRRAGFAATWGEIQRDLREGPQASVRRLLAGNARMDGVPPDFERTAARLAASAVAAADPARLRGWWVYRMLFGPDPLGERLALLWHNHFATSNGKVRDLALMRRQNEEFRELARAPFGALLGRAVRSPALLVWLDAPSNRRGHPNENLARELMELFTLGIGHYTEGDVREAARALTGWAVADGQFHEDPARHDGGDKAFLGRRGRWRGDDLVRVLLDHPATAGRLATRVCELLLGEGAAGPEAVAALAAGLREHDLDVGWAVGTVLCSGAFFHEQNLGNRVRGPAEHVVGAARALELFDPAPSTVALGDWAARLGQDLFHPPNVFGWPEGRAWMTPRTALGRARYAVGLTGGELFGRPAAPDLLALADRHGRAPDLDGILAFYLGLLLGRAPSPAWRERLRDALGPRPGLEPAAVRRAAALVLASPEAQVG